MTTAIDIQGDWQHMGDAIEDVTHTDKTDDSETAEVKANRSELSFREVSANGPAGLEPTDVVWVVWAETLDGVPAQGDTLTDSAGEVWTILSMAVKTIGAIVIKYRCVCRQQV